jgi:two-component system, cell cycle sensor histidine kinase and response regulator CckA
MAEWPGEKLETILIVDDDNDVLNFVVAVLKMADFNVLRAKGGESALKTASEYAGRIDLLLTDLKMPKMSGPDLAEMVKRTRPEIRVMFMSGLANGDLPVLNYGWEFIGKPFVPGKLIEMINVVLHTPERSQATTIQPEQRQSVAIEATSMLVQHTLIPG